jgi:hypothetical protein
MDARLPRTPRILTVLALRFPRTVVIGAAVAAVLALGLAAARLELRFGHTDLIAAGDRYRQLEAQDRLEFEEVPGRVVVVIRADDSNRPRHSPTRSGAGGSVTPGSSALYRMDSTV